MTTDKHIDAHAEDIEDVVSKIGESFDIQFETNELVNVRTFGDLCDHIISRISQQHTDDCTSQQAFYKLRDAIIISKQVDKTSILMDTTLSSIFPRHQRRKQIARIEKILGLKLNSLRPKYFVSGTTAVFLLASLVTLFVNWKIGFAGLVCSVILLRVVNKTGKEFTVNTIGELADKMSMESYVKSRRDPATVNKGEVVKKIEQLFIRYLLLDEKEIPPETILIGRE